MPDINKIFLLILVILTKSAWLQFSITTIRIFWSMTIFSLLFILSGRMVLLPFENYTSWINLWISQFDSREITFTRFPWGIIARYANIPVHINMKFQLCCQEGVKSEAILTGLIAIHPGR